jgi:hypothetical protein
MAMANHNEGVRGEVIEFIQNSRKIQVEAIRRARARSGASGSQITPDALAFIATSCALALSREAELGVTMSHADVEELIAGMLQGLEPAAPSRRQSAGPRRTPRRPSRS